MQWFHRAHCLGKNTSPLNIQLRHYRRANETFNNVVGVVATVIVVVGVAGPTRISASLACVMCLVGDLKGVCSSLNNVPGETTECIENHRVTNTRWLSVHAVVSPGTLFREEHKSFKNST